MQAMVGDGVWRPDDVPTILAYCGEDVEDAVQLLHRLLPEILADAPLRVAALSQAIIRDTFLSAEAARGSVVTLARKMIGAGLPFGAITLNTPLPEETRARPASKPAAKKPAKTAGFRPSPCIDGARVVFRVKCRNPKCGLTTAKSRDGLRPAAVGTRA